MPKVQSISLSCFTVQIQNLIETHKHLKKILITYITINSVSREHCNFFIDGMDTYYLKASAKKSQTDFKATVQQLQILSEKQG